MSKAEIILEAPAEELRAYPVHGNRRRKGQVEGLPLFASPEYQSLLVRTALVRSESYRGARYSVLTSPWSTARLLKHLASSAQEHFVTISLNNRLLPLAVHETGIGTSSQAMAAPPDVLRVILLTGGTGLIVAHNHPSGDPKPSPEDRKMKEDLDKAAQCVGLSLLDAMIVAADGWYSFVNDTIEEW